MPKTKKTSRQNENRLLHKKIPLKPLLNILKDNEKAYIDKEIAALHEENFVNLQDSLIAFSKLATKFDILEESVKRFLADKKIKGYVNLGDYLINKTKLNEIKRKLCNRLDKEEISYSEAVKTIEESGGKNPIRILEVLNFGVKWHGIDPDSAKIYKNESQPDSKPRIKT